MAAPARAALLIAALALMPPALAQPATVTLPRQAEGSPVAAAAKLGDRDTAVGLLREGIDANGEGPDGTPALHWAVRLADAELVAALLDAGADANRANRYGQPPLHVAVQYRHADMIRRLLAAGADIEQPDGAGEPPLILATRLGATGIVAVLLAAGAHVDSRDSVFGQTALMIAVREEQPALVEQLLAAGADVDALSFAGEEGRFILPAEVPVGTSKGVGINRMGWPDRGMRHPITGMKTPLQFAARQGNFALVRRLVEAGADLDKADANGITPLINAILNHSIVNVNRTGQSDHLAIAHYLVDAGADVTAKDWYGETALWAAVDIRNLEFQVTATTNRVDREAAFTLIEALIAAGADVNARTEEFPPERRYIAGTGSNGWVDMTGQTPFLRAALAGDLRVLNLLLAHGADPNIATYGGTTPLMVAAGVTWAFSETYDEGADALLATVKLTHALGNDVNAVNEIGIRAIHGAANRGSNDIIAWLADNGAELNVRDNEGRTAVTWAEGVLTGARAPFSKPDTIRLLESLQPAAAARRDD